MSSPSDLPKITPSPAALVDRSGCCDTWPKPCPYHEGWLDGINWYVEHVLGPPVSPDELRRILTEKRGGGCRVEDL